MDEITLDGKTYVSSKRAAKITGYAKDYVGQLCREGRVEARLVGRNWYVLESSLREHRFGSELKKEVISHAEGSEVAPTTAWQPSTYASEAPNAFPKFASKVPETVEFPQPTAPLSESNAVKEMQNAWQDWFTRKSEEKPTEEVLLEDPEIMLKREYSLENHQPEPVQVVIEPVIVSESVQQAEAEEIIHITRVEQEKPVQAAFEPVHTAPYTGSTVAFEHDVEETVPIHRTYVPPVTVTPPSARYSDYGNTRQKEPVYAPEGRVIKERRVKRKKKPSVVLSALMISVALIAVAVAIVGSGKFTNLFGSRSNYAPVQFIEGQSSVVGNSK